MDVPSQRQVRQTLRSIGGAIAAVIALVAAIATVAPAAQGALPGANGKIAFVIDGDIFVMRSDGANETRLPATRRTTFHLPSRPMAPGSSSHATQAGSSSVARRN